MSAPRLELLLGQRIVGAILKEGQGPASQLFLVFEDGTYTELYSDAEIYVSAGWEGGARRAKAYMAGTHQIVQEAHLSAAGRPPAGRTVVRRASAAVRRGPDRRSPALPPGTPKDKLLAIWRTDLDTSLKN